ncbi:sensor histidine kinase [Microbacterium sp. RD1]|uniref:sensor histidine kinase n=1 Tax=Microbacterium sp. RD1 TaxID=3457313 RepID=UPI003FA60095
MPSDELPRFRPSPLLRLLIPVVFAFLVQVPTTLAVSLFARVGPLAVTASVALAAGAALALLAARRWPGPTVAVVSAMSLAALLVPPDAGPPLLALPFAIISAVARGARMWALLSVGVAWAAAVIAAGFLDSAWHPIRIAVTTLGLVLCFAIGEGIRTRMAAAAERRAQLAERRRTVEQQERARIARELHDVLAHSLSQIAVQSGVGLHLFDREPEKAREALASIRTLSATGLDEVRGVLGFLRGDERTPTAPLTPQPQLADLPALAAARSGLGLTVSFEDHLGGDAPPSAVQTAAYRIVQEALTNVVRHSAATSAVVRIDRSDDHLVVRVADDGTGIPADGVAGGGIRGMHERAELAGGTIELADAAGGGTIVVARLPWNGASP